MISFPTLVGYTCPHCQDLPVDGNVARGMEDVGNETPIQVVMDEMVQDTPALSQTLLTDVLHHVANGDSHTVVLMPRVSHGSNKSPPPLLPLVTQNLSILLTSMVQQVSCVKYFPDHAMDLIAEKQLSPSLASYPAIQCWHSFPSTGIGGILDSCREKEPGEVYSHCVLSFMLASKKEGKQEAYADGEGRPDQGSAVLTFVELSTGSFEGDLAHALHHSPVVSNLLTGAQKKLKRREFDTDRSKGDTPQTPDKENPSYGTPMKRRKSRGTSVHRITESVAQSREGGRLDSPSPSKRGHHPKSSSITCVIHLCKNAWTDTLSLAKNLQQCPITTHSSLSETTLPLPFPALVMSQLCTRNMLVDVNTDMASLTVTRTAQHALWNKECKPKPQDKGDVSEEKIAISQDQVAKLQEIWIKDREEVAHWDSLVAAAFQCQKCSQGELMGLLLKQRLAAQSLQKATENLAMTRAFLSVKERMRGMGGYSTDNSRRSSVNADGNANGEEGGLKAHDRHDSVPNLSASSTQLLASCILDESLNLTPSPPCVPTPSPRSNKQKEPSAEELMTMSKDVVVKKCEELKRNMIYLRRQYENLKKDMGAVIYDKFGEREIIVKDGGYRRQWNASLCGVTEPPPYNHPIFRKPLKTQGIQCSLGIPGMFGNGSKHRALGVSAGTSTWDFEDYLEDIGISNKMAENKATQTADVAGGSGNQTSGVSGIGSLLPTQQSQPQSGLQAPSGIGAKIRKGGGGGFQMGKDSGLQMGTFTLPGKWDFGVQVKPDMVSAGSQSQQQSKPLIGIKATQTFIETDNVYCQVSTVQTDPNGWNNVSKYPRPKTAGNDRDSPSQEMEVEWICGLRLKEPRPPATSPVLQLQRQNRNQKETRTQEYPFTAQGLSAIVQSVDRLTKKLTNPNPVSSGNKLNDVASIWKSIRKLREEAVILQFALALAGTSVPQGFVASSPLNVDVMEEEARSITSPTKVLRHHSIATRHPDMPDRTASDSYAGSSPRQRRMNIAALSPRRAAQQILSKETMDDESSVGSGGRSISLSLHDDNTIGNRSRTSISSQGRRGLPHLASDAALSSAKSAREAYSANIRNRAQSAQVKSRAGR